MRYLQTAQVASQQGKYLGRKLVNLASKHDVLEANFVKDLDEAVSGPFRYKHLGNLAYIGNAAVFDFGPLSVMGGLAAMYAWRSVYWSEQVSARTRALLMIDWIIRYARRRFCHIAGLMLTRTLTEVFGVGTSHGCDVFVDWEA